MFPGALALSTDDSFPDTLESSQSPLLCALGILAAVFGSGLFELRKQRKETVLNPFQLTLWMPYCLSLSLF